VLKVFRRRFSRQTRLLEKVQREIFGWRRPTIEYSCRIEKDSFDHQLALL
jgi:hypothetical protein